MKKSSSLCNILVMTIVLLAAFVIPVNAQVLDKPTTVWSAACASPGFNSYTVSFTWSPPLVNSDNEFVLELSDANGIFASPTELARVSDKNTDFNFDFNVAVPTDIAGEGYTLRVRSTSPSKTSPATDPYPMYYAGFNSPILISQDGSGSIPPCGKIVLDTGDSVTLEPHNVPSAGNYNYNWYRSGTLLAEKSAQLTVSSSGTYFVEIDYGTVCSGSANTLSNNIEIAIGASSLVGIDGPNNVQLCTGDSYTLQSNTTIVDTGITYTWYKDGVVVAGPSAAADSYNIDASVSGFEGDYEVEVNSATYCLERSPTVTITNQGGFTATAQNDLEIVLLPTQTVTLSTSTTAVSPTYQWFRNGSAMTGETGSTLDVNLTGNYFARVTETSGSCSAAPIDTETTSVTDPASFEFVVAYVGQYTTCASSDATLNLATINAVNSVGAKTDVTAELQSSFSYQWKKDGTNIGGETSRTITVSSFTDNGDYELDGVLGSFNTTSNILEVRLLSNETLEVSSTGTVLCDGADPIVLSTSRDLTSESFQWMRNGQVVDSSSETITATEVGDYQLVIDTGDCPLTSNLITVNAFDESLLSLDRPQDLIIIEGETETVTASGAQSYEWFDSNNALLGTQDFFSFQQEGEYLLVASFGNCSISRVITVTYRDTFAVPNVITANGDGINDLWVLPNTYSRNNDVLVTIFDETGKEVFSQTNYENNWPQSTTAFNRSSMIFYYKITRGGSSLKQGTITVIR